MNRKRSVVEIVENHAYGIMLMAIIALLAVFYWPYYIGESIYLASSDLAFERYPLWLHFFDFFAENGWQGWDYSVAVGGGQNFKSFLTNIDAIPLLFGKRLFPYVLIWYHSLKVILAGSFFFAALKQFKMNKFACIYGGIFYSFCAIMVVRSNWGTYAIELVLAAFLLFALERYFQRKQWWLLLLAIVLLGTQQSEYALFFYSVLMFFYATLRHIIVGGKFKEWFPYMGKCALIMLGALILLSYKLYPNIVSMLSTSRFDSIAQNVSSGSIFSRDYLIGSFNRNVAIINSFFAISLEWPMGGSAFCPNSLDGPLFYCGILTLLLVPQAYRFLSKKAKRVMAIIGIIIFAFLAVPIVTYVFNLGISGNYFKLNTLWIIMLLLGLSVYALDYILKNGRVKSKLLIGTYLVLATIFLLTNFSTPDMRARINISMAIKVLIFLSLWTVFWIVWSKKKWAKKLGHICILLFCISEIYIFVSPTTEAFFSASKMLAGHVNMDSEHYKKNELLINNIKEREGKDNFYRVYFKDELTGFSYNTENQRYGFRGTGYATAYVNKGYVNFLQVVEVDTDLNPIWRRNAGPKTRYMIASLLGIKYFILPQNEVSAKGLMEIDGNEQFTVYENKNALPLGVGIDKFISKEEFENLSIRQKDIALLNAVVTDDENLLKNKRYVSDLEVQYKNLSAGMFTVENVENVKVDNENSIEFKTTSGGRINIPIYQDPWSEENEYILSFEIWAGNAGTISVQWLKDGQWYNKQVDYNGSGDKVHITIDDTSSEWIVIDFFSHNVGIRMQNMRYEYSNSDEIDRLYQEAIEARRNCAVEYSMYSDSHMKGIVEAKEDTILFYAMSYDEGWKVTVDGEEVECEIVDYGFLGVPVKKGAHEIELVYEG